MNVDTATGLGVDEHGHADQASPQRDIIDPEHPRHRQLGQGDRTVLGGQRGQVRQGLVPDPAPSR